MRTQPKICDLSGALARMGGDSDLLQQLVNFFREDAPQYLAKMHAAAQAGDAAGLQQASHSLHGLVATFGAEAASMAIERVEEMGRTCELTGVEDALGVVDDEVSLLQSSLPRESVSG